MWLSGAQNVAGVSEEPSFKVFTFNSFTFKIVTGGKDYCIVGYY